MASRYEFTGWLASNLDMAIVAPCDCVMSFLTVSMVILASLSRAILAEPFCHMVLPSFSRRKIPTLIMLSMAIESMASMRVKPLFPFLPDKFI